MRYNTITFDTNAENGHKSLHKMIDVLLDNGYIMVVRYEDCGIASIDYSYADDALGEAYPTWLTPEEREELEVKE